MGVQNLWEAAGDGSIERVQEIFESDASLTPLSGDENGARVCWVFQSEVLFRCASV